jgi:hypothetical protein
VRRKNEAIKYLGHCRKCKLALYEEDGQMKTAGPVTKCRHALAKPYTLITRYFKLHPDEDAYLNEQAIRNRVSRAQYLRALIAADKYIVEAQDRPDICGICKGTGRNPFRGHEL